MNTNISYCLSSLFLVSILALGIIVTNQSIEALRSTTVTDTNKIPSAQSVYQSQSISLPKSVGTFVWYIVNEAHEDTHKEPQKLMSNHNPNFIPTKLTIQEGVSILFLDTDAPWDTPHPHTIEITDKSSGKVVYIQGNSIIPIVPNLYIARRQICCGGQNVSVDERSLSLYYQTMKKIRTIILQ